MLRFRFIAPFCALVLCADLHAQQLPSAAASAITNAPVIDGRLDEAAWAEAQVLSGFV